MRCHYEVLGLPLNASLDDIKKAYRKCALQWHPDKHLDNKEEANVKFLEVQDAFETLSNDQERAWYDSHREIIINGGNPGEPGEANYVFNIYPYFSSTCFRGFDDSEKGFYTVYRDVFARLAEEDKPHYDDDKADPPEFGDANSDYDTVVGPFYAFWSAYCTPRSFVWVEKHDTREATDRYVRRLMEKENKKLRDKAKKERNEEIRKLVEFVRKKDKRVEEYRKVLEQRAQLAQQKAKEKKEADRARRAEQMKAYVAPAWSQLDDELEKLDLQYGGGASGNSSSSDSDDSDTKKNESKNDTNNDNTNNETNESEAMRKSDGEVSSTEEEEDTNDLFCVACEKSFKSAKSFQNHEKSKKHRENVEMLKKHMKDEDLNFFSVNNNNETSQEAETNNTKTKLSKKQKKNKRKQARANKRGDSSDDDDDENDDDNGDNEAVDAASSSTRDNDPAAASAESAAAARSSDPRTTTTSERTISTGDEPKNLKCSVCQAEFNSRNKLFEHIKLENHAILKTTTTAPTAAAKASKNRKSKK